MVDVVVHGPVSWNHIVNVDEDWRLVCCSALCWFGKRSLRGDVVSGHHRL